MSIHSSVPNGLFSHEEADIAIARLNKDAIFSPMVGPICLPAGVNTKDRPSSSSESMKAYVAGWGTTFFKCDSNMFGPNPNTQCKFPFMHNGKKHDKCTTTLTPSANKKVIGIVMQKTCLFFSLCLLQFL